MKKIRNTDFSFVIALLSVLLIHIFYLFIVPFSQDESFYVSIPLRLVNGDSLVQHEWHLTQFSSLFTWLPVYIWNAVKGSTEGIFIFLRCVYLLIHTTVAVVIYRFFRKYGKWAIMASMIFYIQISYRIQAISYQSMYVVFLLLLSLCLISVYEKKSVKFYIFAGICFGCCCVCNPFFCFAFVLYLLVCLLWTQRYKLMKSVTELKTFQPLKKEKKLTKRQKREQKKQKQQLIDSFPDLESYNCFFTKEAVLWFACGIVIVVIIAIGFFFSTGATLNSLGDNIDNLLGSSEYDIASKSVFSKFIKTIEYFSKANLGMPWILPIIFVVLSFDTKKKCNTHRFGYLFASVLWSIMFIVMVLLSADIYLCAISLPFSVISFMCYLLTEKKNKVLFYCMFIPSSIATFVQYLAADTHWATIGIVLAVNNIAGVFFAMDLWKEMRSDSLNESEVIDEKKKKFCYRSIIIVGFCLQIIFHGLFYMYGQIPMENVAKATSGPYKGLYMSGQECDNYNKTINDLDYIKAHSGKYDPVLIASYNTWMYIHLEKPFATYTTWYRGNLDTSQLKEYYIENPKKMPKYIYIESPNPNSTLVESTMNTISELFEFTKEELSNGVLLIVKE